MGPTVALGDDVDDVDEEGAPPRGVTRRALPLGDLLPYVSSSTMFLLKMPHSTIGARQRRWALCAVALLGGATFVACDAPSRSEPRSVGRGTPSSPEEWGGLRVQVRGDPDASTAVVLLHGFGARGDDLVGLGAHVARATQSFAVMPEAPEVSEGNPEGRQWWDLREWRQRRAAGEDLSDQVPDGLEAASRRVHGVLRTLEARGFPPRAVVVAGFSQGAVLAMDAGLTAERAPRGIAALSGTLIARSRWQRAARSFPAPILLTHGRSDSVLTFTRARALRSVLEDVDARVEMFEFEGGHVIPSEASDRLIAWLRQLPPRP